MENSNGINETGAWSGLNATETPDLEDEWGSLPPFSFPRGFQIGAHICYNLVLFLGLIGNGCVLLIFLRRQSAFAKLPTPLLANLAVGDLLITIFCLETSYLSVLWQYWPFGKFLCFALSPVKPIAVFVSCYTLIALSVDRLLQIEDPIKRRVLSTERVKWTIGVIWFMAVLTSLPVGLFTDYQIHSQSGLPRCGEYAWESETEEFIYDLALLSLQFFLPVLIVTYTYTRMSILVCKSKAKRLRMSHGHSPGPKGETVKTIRMSLMVGLGYTIAWLPYNLVYLLARYYGPLEESEAFPYVFVACHWLAMSHSVYNPIIYFWLNKSFRYMVMEVFCRKKVRNMERRKLSTHLSWRSTVVTSTRSSNSITTRPSARSKSFSTSTVSPECNENCPAWPLIDETPERIHLTTKGEDTAENEETTLAKEKNGVCGQH